MSTIRYTMEPVSKKNSQQQQRNGVNQSFEITPNRTMDVNSFVKNSGRNPAAASTATGIGLNGISTKFSDNKRNSIQQLQKSDNLSQILDTTINVYEVENEFGELSLTPSQSMNDKNVIKGLK
jgi:hypothetical protein